MTNTVYIFDDDEDIRIMCSIVLRQSGYTVLSAGTCEDIIAKVTAAKPDVVLMDNSIPPDGGIVATKQLMTHPETSHIPVIYFSANTNVQQVSLEAGAPFFIQKPFDLAALEDILKQAIASNPQVH
jgi:two-component system alkaline phosphatase synthesis response regulator PhoP